MCSPSWLVRAGCAGSYGVGDRVVDAEDLVDAVGRSPPANDTTAAALELAEK
jgi:hypothetical protein